MDPSPLLVTQPHTPTHTNMITILATYIIIVTILAVGIALPAATIITLEREWLDHKRRKAEWARIRAAVAAHATITPTTTPTTTTTP